MDATNIKYISEFIEIPPIFYSYSTQKPFEECLVCQKKLLADGTQYVIEKAIKQYPGFDALDVVTESAICLTCHAKMQATLSLPSRQTIENYFNQHVDIESRRKKLLREKATLDAWINHCLIYGTPRHQLSEYQIYAQCDGKHMLFTYMPYLISGKAIEEIAGLLSAETKDVLDNFIDEHFGLPPELNRLLKDRKMVLL